MSQFLTFLVPLRSRVNTNDWSLVSNLCRLTLQSLHAQSSNGSQTLLICHELPEGENALPDSVEVVKADFPPPSQSAFACRDNDKWRKLQLGLSLLAADPSEFFMFVDADDWVHRNLSEHLQRTRPNNGAAITKGYLYEVGSGWVRRNNQHWCGTSFAIRSRSVHPRNRNPLEIERCLALTAGHTSIATAMREAGKPLDNLPFRGAVNLTHPEQHSKLGQSGESRVTLRMRAGMARQAVPLTWVASRFRLTASQIMNACSTPVRDSMNRNDGSDRLEGE